MKNTSSERKSPKNIHGRMENASSGERELPKMNQTLEEFPPPSVIHESLSYFEFGWTNMLYDLC
jgi:hypothetical protein